MDEEVRFIMLAVISTGVTQKLFPLPSLWGLRVSSVLQGGR